MNQFDYWLSFFRSGLFLPYTLKPLFPEGSN